MAKEKVLSCRCEEAFVAGVKKAATDAGMTMSDFIAACIVAGHKVVIAANRIQAVYDEKK